MAVDAKTLRAMQSAGISLEQIIKFTEQADLDERERQAEKRESARMRKRRQRDRENDAKTTVMSHAGRVTDVTSVTARDTPSPPPPPSPKENNPSPQPPPQPVLFEAGDIVGDAFEDQFWPLYPNKVGKADARKKFPAAVRKVGLPVLLDALRRYAAKTDDRPWLNPATWLFQERWNDQPAQQPRASPGRRMSQADELEQQLREKYNGRGYASGRQGGVDLQAPAGLLAAGRKT